MSLDVAPVLLDWRALDLGVNLLQHEEVVGISRKGCVSFQCHHYIIQSISSGSYISFYYIILSEYFLDHRNDVNNSGKFAPVGFLVLRVTWGGSGCCYSVVGCFPHSIIRAAVLRLSLNDPSLTTIYVPFFIFLVMFLHVLGGVVGCVPCVYITMWSGIC